MVVPELGASNDNTITTAALRFDNSLNWCNHPNRKGGWEVTMSGSIPDMRCSGRRPTAEAIRDSVTSSGASFATVPGAIRHSISNSETSIQKNSRLNRSADGMRGSGDVPVHRTFLMQKVLRFSQWGRRNSLRLLRISSDSFRNSLAVEGDALIHGPRLVARPVGSERRTRRPYQGSIQTN